jgi:hypothetical protein
MKASCHCGAVRFEIAEPPTRVSECNCSICACLGALWAYYHPRQVTRLGEPGQTFPYVWGDRTIAFHTCRTCGCTTHWEAIEVEDPERMGVNARLMEGLDRQNVELRHLDGGGHGRFWTR